MKDASLAGDGQLELLLHVASSFFEVLSKEITNDSCQVHITVPPLLQGPSVELSFSNTLTESNRNRLITSPKTSITTNIPTPVFSGFLYLSCNSCSSGV